MIGPIRRTTMGRGMIGAHKPASFCLAAALTTGVALAAPTTAPTVATAPATQRAIASATQPTDIPGVENFAQVSPILYRGAQPTAEGFAELKKRGIRTVVSLRSFHDDRKLLVGTGLRYVRIPAKTWHPEDEDVLAFFKALRDPANQPVFVHCQQGADRTGCVVAIHRMVDDGWTLKAAVAEMEDFGFHPIWREISEYLTRFDAQTLNKRLESVESPKVEIIE